jgi:hypothetical protein
MKTRIICAIAVLGTVCLLARIAPTISNHCSRAGIGGPTPARSPAATLRTFRHLRDEWVRCALTAQAAVRYLLEPEPPEVSNALVASNCAGKTLFRPEASVPPTPASARSDLSMAFEGPAETHFAIGSPCASQSVFASLNLRSSGMNSLPFRFELAFGPCFADSRAALPIAGRCGDVLEQSCCLNGSRSYIIIAIPDSVTANFRCASKAPAKCCLQELIDSVERPG